MPLKHINKSKEKKKKKKHSLGKKEVISYTGVMALAEVINPELPEPPNNQLHHPESPPVDTVQLFSRKQPESMKQAPHTYV